MLRNILSPETCAKCRICCIFEKIHAARPELKFVSKGDSGAYIFNMEETWDSERELFICPALDPDKGCTLGDNKPFDCKIWPYRIMEFNGVRVISVASICPDMYAKPLNKLVGELENGLADKIFAEADKDPAMIKPYEQGYPILKVELQGRKET